MELLLPHLLFFDPERDNARERKVQRAVEQAPEPPRRLFCAACKHLVTHQHERIAVQGGHEHRFTNPQGIAYRIGCFRRADGCSPIGQPTTEFTWFRGYAWLIALCANCHGHLGWRFQSSQDFFHGLIADRLTSAERNG